MWLPLILILSIFRFGCSLNQKRFDKLRLQSEFHPKVVFANEFHSKNGSDLLSQRGSLLHDDPLLDDEYRSHFVESNYDFMIPEGQQEKPSIAAILSFVSDPAVESPTFSIHDDFDWFTIGSQKSQVNGEGILETEVSIDTKEGVLIDSKRVDGENYSLQVTGISGNRSVSVPVRVDILPSFGVIKVMSEDIKSQSTKKEDESEIAVDSREEIEGREVKTSPKITPMTTELTTTEITREEPTTTSFRTTEPTTTTTQTTTVPTKVSTTPTTIITTVTVPSTTVTTTESTTTSTTAEPSTTSTSQLTTTESTTVSTTPSPTVTTTPSTTVVTIPSTTVSTTVQSTTTTHPSTSATVPIRLNIEGLSENGSIPVMASLSKGELINNFAITVERDGRPDGTLFNVTVDRSDLFDIQPKSVEQGGKAFLFVRNPHLIREIKGLTITIKAASSLTSDSTSLPIFLITDPSSEIIRFSIPESSSNGIKIGDLPDRSIERILALDGLPFNLVKSSLFLSCETPQCLDRETNDHYEFFVKFTDSAYPIPVVVSVSDINDNPPTISLTEHIIRVASNRLLNPVAVFISDLDSSSDSNAILLTGDASHYFAVKHIEEGIYDLQLTSSPSNGNYSLTVTVVDTTHPEFPSHSIDVAIVVQRGKARFRKELYERTLAADKITFGDSLLRLELEGVPIDEVDIMCLGGNPGWITVEPYGGKMSVATLPRKVIEGGELTLVMGAIDRETSELVADTRVKITVEGGVKKEKKIVSPFHKIIYTFKTIREHSESDSHSSFSVDLDLRDSSVSPSLIPSSLFALDSNGISTSFPISSLSLNGSTLSIERSSFANLRLLQIEVEAEEQTASVLIFFSSSSIVMERLRRERSRPLFAIPEGTEDDPIEISMMEESPSGTVVAVFPATDVSKGENVETRLEGEMKEFFHIQQTTGALIIAHPFDLESLSSPFFNLSLLAGEEPFESRLSLHFTVLNIDDNPPIVHTDSRMINTTIWENAALSSRVAIIKASDIDSPSLRFTLVGEKADKFAVKSSEEGGIITIEKEIDREEDGDQLSLIVLVIDSAGHTAEAMVNIRIMDVNDNSPSFVSIHSTQLKAVENWGEGRLLSILTAEDEDEGENGRVMYRLTQSSPYISIDKLTGELKLARNLIGMAGVEIPLTVMAHDMGSPQRSTLLNLTVSVLESMGKESLTPKIINLPEDFVIQVNDQSPIRSRIFTVSALSPSEGKEGLKYDLLPSTPSEAGWMDVNEETGDIYLLRSIDSHEKRDISISQDIDSIGESGYLSTLELHSPYDFSDASTHVSPRERDYRFSPRGRSSHLKSMDELRNIKTPLPYMSRADTLAVLDSPSMNEHDFLLRNVIQTKIITCVFEITNSGIEGLLDDISHEFSRWFKGNPPLMAVSTEVQWSVPVKHRSRLAESRLKDLVLVRLRENNRRLLHMRGGGRDLPLSLAHATTNEKIMKDTDIDAYQGVYRRCYRNLLPYVHSETPEWHSEYWKVDQGTEEQTLPQPDQFLFGKKKESLVNKSLVALNMAGLEIRGCGVLTVKSSSSSYSFTRSIVRLHVNSTNESLLPPIKKNIHLVFPVGTNGEWPKIIGSLPTEGGSVERIFHSDCSNSSSISISESGEISLMDDPNAMDDMDVCVLARRGSSKEGTVLRFTILNEEKEKKKELFIPPHAHSIVLGKDGIYENSVFTMEKDEVEYKLKSVNFTRAEKSFIDSDMKKEDFSSLFVIDPSTARIIVDPIVRMKDNGFYDVTIEAMKDNETIGEFKREIHSVPSSSQVRLVFDMTTHELGRNLETFETKLNQILTGRGKVYLAQPLMDTKSNKSSVCVHVLLNSSLMSQSTAFSLLSLPPSDSPLTNLYHSYKVSNLGTCDASISVSSLISSSFSSSFIITSSIVSLLSFILISSILYVCCVLRERDRCRKMENSMNKESESPQMGAPGQFYSLTGTQAMITPYGLY